MTDDILQHLIRGWGGLANILSKATEAGFRMPDDELKLLDKMHGDMEAVIQKQRARREGK